MAIRGHGDAGRADRKLQQQLSDLDGVFYDGDSRLVHCGVNLDTSANASIASVDSALDRARDRGEVVELYAHHPGDTVPIEKIEHVLSGARDRHLAFYTYADFAARPTPAPGSRCRSTIPRSTRVRAPPAAAAYHARITFFVSRYRTSAPTSASRSRPSPAMVTTSSPHVQHLARRSTSRSMASTRTFTTRSIRRSRSCATTATRSTRSLTRSAPDRRAGRRDRQARPDPAIGRIHLHARPEPLPALSRHRRRLERAAGLLARAPGQRGASTTAT